MDQDESDEPAGPVVKLTYAILLSMIKQAAESFWVRRDGKTYVVEFLIGGEAMEEMRGPSEVFAQVIRRMSVMARLPVYGKGDSAIGVMQILVGIERFHFEIEVRGPGSNLNLCGHLLTDAESVGPYR